MKQAAGREFQGLDVAKSSHPRGWRVPSYWGPPWLGLPMGTLNTQKALDGRFLPRH